MLRLVAILFGAALFLGTTTSCRAGDACDKIGMRGIRPPAARVEIEREAATKIIVHIERACGLIATLQKDHHEPAVSHPLDRMGAQLNALVLAPIYREHPDLRRLTAADSLPPTLKPQPGAHPVMGAATATYLRWALSTIERNITRVPETTCAAEPCLRPLLDLLSEIGFAKGQVYVGYPRLFRLDMKETDRGKHGRTAKSDAAFREHAPKAGAVSVSPAALKVARDFLDSLAKDAGRRCEIAAFSWNIGARSKGPDDTEWKALPPGVELGTYSCREIPPDIVRRIGGLPIAFFDDTPGRFAGKIVDWENGKFVLRARGATPER